MQIGIIHVITEIIKMKELTIISINIQKHKKKSPFFVILMMQLELIGRKESIEIVLCGSGGD